MCMTPKDLGNLLLQSDNGMDNMSRQVQGSSADHFSPEPPA